jgi:predicted nucleic acid-binding protein
LVVPAPALVESYSVMTRLPAPHRLSPPDALELLAGSFESQARVVGLGGRETWRFLHTTAGAGVAGGRAYDALVLSCVQKAGADRLLTLDRRDFTRLDPGSVEIVVPSA